MPSAAARVNSDWFLNTLWTKPCPQGFEYKTEDSSWCEPVNPKCIELQKVGNSFVMKNSCISGSIENAQAVMHCVGVIRANTRCLDVADSDQMTTVNFASGGSLTLQYVTPQKVKAVGIFRPPTASGGTKTRQENVWYFKVACFIGTHQNDNAWHTLDTQAVQMSHRAGWVTYNIKKECPKPSTTWRIYDMKPAFEMTSYLTLSEIKVDRHEDPRHTRRNQPAVHPPLGRVLMSILEGTKVVKTQFAGAAPSLMCRGCIALPILGIPLHCEAIRDGNVNTPAVFANDDKPQVCCVILTIVRMRSQLQLVRIGISCIALILCMSKAAHSHYVACSTFLPSLSCCL